MLADMKPKYDAGKVEYTKGKAKYDVGMKELNSKTDAYKTGKKMLADMKPKYDTGKVKYTKGKAKYDEGMKKLNSKTDAYKTGKKFLAEIKPAYDKGKPIYDALLKKVNDNSATEEEKEKLKAITPDIIKYEKGLAQVKEYEAGNAALNVASKQLVAAKAQLDDGKIKLEAGKTKLEDADTQLKDGKEQLTEFEDGEEQVLAGYATIAKNPTVNTKIDNGINPIVAARQVVDEETVKTTDELMSRVYLYIAMIVVAVIGCIAAIMGINLSTMSADAKKLKTSVILGVISMILAIIANIYGAANGYTAFPVQMTATILEVVFALLFVVAIFHYENAVSNKIAK